MFKLSVCLVISSVIIADTAGSVVIENDYLRVEITEDWNGDAPPGSLLEFTSFVDPTGNALTGMAYAGKLFAGDFKPAPGSFETISPSEGTFTSSCLEDGSGAMLPARTSFHYRLSGKTLTISWRMDCDAEVTFSDGLHWGWDLSPWEQISAYNQAGKVDSFEISSVSGTITRSLRAGWQLKNSDRALWLIQPDPFQARWRFSNGYLQQEWLHSRDPKTTLDVTQYPKICSTLSPEHSIWGDVQLMIASADDDFPADNSGWMFLSGIPGGAEQGLMFMWDEAPIPLDDFSPMTTPSNPDTPYGSKIVQLMENHPAMKQVLLLGMDKILSGYPFQPNLPNWSVPESFVCIDTLEQVEGSGALTVSHYTARDTWVTQSVSCNPGESLTLTGWVRVDSIASGWAGVWIEGDSVGIVPTEFHLTGPAGWTYCQAELNVADNTSLTLQVGMTGGPGKARFDDLQLLRPGEPDNLLANAGFNDFSFNVSFDDEGTEWWHVHSWRRIATEAPPEYLDFLHLLESGETSYGWEDRMGLGIHCYHHTPNELYPLDGDNTHEFNFYDPEGDSARFSMINRDLADAGLTNKSFQVIRFPGHKHQMPTVREGIKSGVLFMDRGPDYSYNAWLGPIILPEGVIWETNTAWWADEASACNPDLIYTLLGRGELVLAGGHPAATFPSSNPGYFDVVDGVFTQAENSYPYLTYLFPGDYAQLCEQSRTWWEVEYYNNPNDYELGFYGTASAGQTAVMMLGSGISVVFPPLVDCQPVEFEVRDNRIFIQLPELDWGYHTVSLEKGLGLRKRYALPNTFYLGKPYPNPVNGWVSFPLELPRAADIECCLTDVMGRMVFRERTTLGQGSRRYSIPLNTLSSGVYFYQLKVVDQVRRGKITLLK